MFEKLYSNKTEKDLKSALKLYRGLSIVGIVLLILFNAFSYFTTERIRLFPSIIFGLIILWSFLNINYLSKKLK